MDKTKIKNFLCNTDAVFNKQSLIHHTIISFIKGRYIKDCKNKKYTNIACKIGYLFIIHDLRANGIHCTSDGANRAAQSGNLNIIHDLRANGIHCTLYGANLAAGNSHLNIIHDLRANGIFET
jgi:hypothetical protein